MKIKGGKICYCRGANIRHNNGVTMNEGVTNLDREEGEATRKDLLFCMNYDGKTEGVGATKTGRRGMIS